MVNRAVYIHYKGQIDEIIGLYYDFYTWPTHTTMLNEEYLDLGGFIPLSTRICGPYDRQKQILCVKLA